MLNFVDPSTLEVNLEHSRQSPLSPPDFEAVLALIHSLSAQPALTLHLNLIGLKVKEKGLSALSSFLDSPLQVAKLALINIGLEERGSLTAFLARNTFFKGALL